MQLPHGLASLLGPFQLTYAVHRLPKGPLKVLSVYTDSPDSLTPALSAIASELCLIAESRFEAAHYEKRLIQIARRHGIYPTAHYSHGDIVYKFTEGEASVALYIAYRKARKPCNL